MKRILITGASYGIGAEVAKEYARKGAKIVLVARSENKLKKLCEEMKSKDVFYFACDVADKAQVSSATDFAIEKMGGVDIAILNAGISKIAWYNNYQSDVTKEVFNVNVFGVMYFFETLIPLMKKQKSGVLVGVSSLADSRGYPGSGSYCASKAALSLLLESARVELKSLGIRVMTVRPGFIETNMTAKNDFYMPFLMSVEKAGKNIVKKIEKGETRYNFPLITTIMVTILKLLPGKLFDFMAKFRKNPLLKE